MAFRLNVFLGDQRVGQILETDSGNFFEYDVLWLRNGIDLSPFHLSLKPGVFGPKHWGTGRVLPGLFEDALPDKFGMSVLMRRFEEAGHKRPSLVRLLAHLGNKTMGALTFEPSEGPIDKSDPVNIASAARSAHHILSHQDNNERLDSSLMISGATAGGAQPKMLVAISDDGKCVCTGSDEIPPGFEPWILKFAAGPDDNQGKLEHAYFEIAEEAGILVPETRLIQDEQGGHHFAIRRFDRRPTNPNSRIHLHTYASMQHLDFKSPENDYAHLLRTTYALTKNQRDVEEQFRRMVFNFLAHNRDDHAKNFSFLYDDSWRISPAYDLVFCDNTLGRNWMLIGGRGHRIDRAHFQDIGRIFSISAKRIDEILDSVKAAVGLWPSIADRHGLPDGYAAAIARSMPRLGE
ncbi:MAG: type II toxin-antitoxin system HipA family toxin [Opitutales bacterium]|nr:type II toxin-antitoxin system HipA family toxin [Opitutales bacterium]NRA27504.1 type II toxin-antitoxin system HipA family toxin [Opitutales bacterium]